MNAILCLALGLLATATLCHGQCMTAPLRPDPATGKLPKGCRDDKGVLHPFGSRWNSKDCYDCSCDRSGAHCCNLVPTYFGLPESCKVVVNKDCTHKLVNTKGPDSDCVPQSAVI
ncbi:beta-microseminoprotein-like [Polypterus senegalus]|uniref:beta-microseminoprotein-like n=1 Tax=Polypterus senegalus TaxID=55291 RepID=UPI0019659D07|nr:beta-microseminoprotein-like [Polypterus senegalus]